MEIGNMLVTIDSEGKKIPQIPIDGIGFIPPFSQIKVNNHATLLLRASIPDVVENGSLFNIESNNANIHIITKQVKITSLEDYIEIGEAKVKIEGIQIGANGTITAFNKSHTTEALVEVIAKPEITKKWEKKKVYKGIFRDIYFDHNLDPRQRVYFNSDTGVINISTQAKSVKLYIKEAGVGAESPEGTVMLSELVSEAVCRELAGRGIESGLYPSVPGKKAEGIRINYNRLQNKYTHIIHEMLSTNKESVRRGRKTKQEIEDEAILAI